MCRIMDREETKPIILFIAAVKSCDKVITVVATIAAPSVTATAVPTSAASSLLGAFWRGILTP